jgi:hypothetical protein
MTTPIVLPVTLATAGVLGLIYQLLAARVIRGRFLHHVSIGDGDNKDLRNRIRTHANFAEYIPLLLILMGLLELAGANATALAWGGVAIVACRVLHAVGMPLKAPNPYRFLGMIGTFLALIAGSVYALVLAIG